MKARLLPLIKKEFIQIFRTKPMLGFIFVVPIVQTLLMGYAVTTEVTRLPTILCDQEHSRYSREFIQLLRQTEYFDVVELTSEYPRVRWALDEGTAAVGIVVPPDLTWQLRTGHSPAVQVVLDGSNSNTAMVALGYLQQIAAGYARRLGVEYTNDFITYRTASPPVIPTPAPRVWYNPNFVNAYFMVPAIIGLILAFSTMILTAISIVREREVGTLEQLMVSPLKSYQIMLGKIVPFALLGFIEISIVLVLGKFYFQIPMRGSFALLFFVSFLMLLTTLGLGLFVSTVTQTQQQSMFMAWFILIFTILMSGFFFPIENMPSWLQRLSYLDPLRYYIFCLRGIFLKGAGLSDLLPKIGALTLYGLGIISFASLRFQKRLK